MGQMSLGTVRTCRQDIRNARQDIRKFDRLTAAIEFVAEHRWQTWVTFSPQQV